MVKKKGGNKKQVKQRKKKGAATRPIFFTMAIVLAIVFLPSAILLLIGMIPSFVAFFVSGKGSSRSLTVASVNLVGCAPFLFELWTTNHEITNAIYIVSKPTTVMIMFGAAGLGYAADWVLTTIISSVLYEQSKMRLKSIKKRQDELIKRWGSKVNGTVSLDVAGFPIEEKK